MKVLITGSADPDRLRGSKIFCKKAIVGIYSNIIK